MDMSCPYRPATSNVCDSILGNFNTNCAKNQISSVHSINNTQPLNLAKLLAANFCSATSLLII